MAAKHNPVILVIDDQYAVESKDFYDRIKVEKIVEGLPFRFEFSSAFDVNVGGYTAKSALHDIDQFAPDGILLDITYGQNPKDRLGLEILRELSRGYPHIPVVMLTALPRDEAWRKCERLGAVDYLVKPLDKRLLWQTLDRYVGVDMAYWLIGQNQHFLDALNLAALAAEGKHTPVMITGETGTGKELFASFIHRHGRGKATPYQVVFLPSVNADLQPDALFGHVSGAFTGAKGNRTGVFEQADGGVVFLDEIGDITEDAQTRLLRVAESGEVRRLGAETAAANSVNVQIVSATNANMPEKIRFNQFRRDLWGRLNGTSVILPSLSQRRDDIPLLVRHMLRRESLKREIPIPELPEAMESILQSLPWEGQVRDLHKYVQRVLDQAATMPIDQAFNKALPTVITLKQAHLHEVRSTPISEEKGNQPSFLAVDISLVDSFPAIQELRLRELELLLVTLEKTRTSKGKTNRADAANWLKGKTDCSTNEFNRWVARIWRELTENSRDIARRRFPEINEIVLSKVESRES